jgi:hypothetical protein
MSSNLSTLGQRKQAGSHLYLQKNSSMERFKNMYGTQARDDLLMHPSLIPELLSASSF